MQNLPRLSHVDDIDIWLLCRGPPQQIDGQIRPRFLACTSIYQSAKTQLGSSSLMETGSSCSLETSIFMVRFHVMHSFIIDSATYFHSSIHCDSLWFIHAFILIHCDSFVHSFIPFIHSFSHSFIHSDPFIRIHWLIEWFIHPSIHSFILIHSDSFIHSSI